MTAFHLASNRRFHLKIWYIWSAMCFIFAFAATPFLLELQGDVLIESMSSDISISIEAMMLINAVINGIVCIILAGLGLLMAARIGLGLPLLESTILKTPTRNTATTLIALGIATGLLSSFIVIAMDSLFFAQPITNILEPAGIDLRGQRPAVWKGLLAAFSAGILEETLFRLFGLTCLLWLSLRIRGIKSGRPAMGVFIIANLIIAIAFAASHISNLALFGIEPTSAIIIRIVVLNGSIAMIYGWLYWHFGLETAVIAHITTDIILQGIGTLASNAGSQTEALIIYTIAHSILLGLAGILWRIESKGRQHQHFTA